MQNKILVLSSSARKNGNTETLCQKLIYGAADAGTAVVHFNINDLNIGFCTGCGRCRTGAECPLEDDMPRILKNIQEARAVVFASPVYFGNVNGQMKTLWDRTYSLYNKDGYPKAAFLTAAADPGGEYTIKALQAFENYAHLVRAEIAGFVMANGAAAAGSLPERYLKKAYELGKCL